MLLRVHFIKRFVIKAIKGFGPILTNTVLKIQLLNKTQTFYCICLMKEHTSFLQNVL